MAGNQQGANVTSVVKALRILDVVGAGPGEITLTEIADAAGLPRPTTHRLVRTLVDCGYLRQQPNRRYTLAPRLIPLGHAASAVFGRWSRSVLDGVVHQLGETTNLAVLDGDQITYVGQAPSPHAMRMYTEVGRRVHAHCRAVGKALLAQLPDVAVGPLLARAGMPAMTAATITTPEAMLSALAEIRRTGFALDRGEQEVGVRCVAVAVSVSEGTPPMALSVSGPETRMSVELISRAVPLLVRAANALSAELSRPTLS